MQTLVMSTCKEKMEWLEATADATTQDFISQRQALEEIVAPVMHKLSEPREYSQSGCNLLGLSLCAVR